MKPESIETYRALEEAAEEAQRVFEEFGEVTPPVEVENLSPTDRIERLVGLIRHMAVYPTEERSMFGAKVFYHGKTVPRIVQTPAGEEYKVHLTVSTRRDGFRGSEHITLSAMWDKLVTKSEDVYGYDEYMDNGWVKHDAELPRGLMLLANLEWSLEAYLNGTPIE